MQRSRQEIVDDGRRHCYLTPPPPCAAWSTALDPRGHSKIQTKMSSDQDLLYEKSKTELSRGPGPENSLSSIHLYRPLLCLCIHLINPDQMSPHLGILFSVFRGFFAYKTFSAIYAISPYRCHFSIAILWLLHRKTNQRCHTSKNGGRNVSSIMHQCHKIQAFLYFQSRFEY